MKMEQRTDLLLDDDFDLVEDPLTLDFVEDVSDDQHVQLLLISQKGENREFPFSGFNAISKLKARFDRTAILRDIEVELENDGYAEAEISLGEEIFDLQIIV